MSGPRNSKNAIIICVSCAILGFFAGFCVKSQIPRGINDVKSEAKVECRIDTVTIERPVPKVIRKLDTIYVSCLDTVTIHDTLYLALEREQKVYEADSSYRAVVSGYMPSLDSIEVYNHTVTRTINAASSKKWSVGIGPQIGAGYVSSFGGGSGAGIFAGLGLSLTYNF